MEEMNKRILDLELSVKKLQESLTMNESQSASDLEVLKEETRQRVIALIHQLPETDAHIPSQMEDAFQILQHKIAQLMESLRTEHSTAINKEVSELNQSVHQTATEVDQLLEKEKQQLQEAKSVLEDEESSKEEKEQQLQAECNALRKQISSRFLAVFFIIEPLVAR